MTRKQYPGAAVKTTLLTAISSTDTSLSVASIAGWPASGPFVIAINRGQTNEEKCLVTARSVTNLTVPSSNRGYDTTSPQSHAVGETVECVLDANTVDEANAHVNDTSRDDHTQYLTVSRHNTNTIHQFGSTSAFGARVNPVATSTALSSGTSNTPAAADHVHTVGPLSVVAGAFAAGAIVNADISASAGIVSTKLAASGATPGSYGSTTLVPVLTINAQGIVTAASTASLTTPAKSLQTSGSVSSFNPASVGSFVIVTGSTVTLTNPADKRNVEAIMTGWVTNQTDASNVVFVRVGLSVDGGSSWSYGSQPETQVGTGAGAAQRAAVVAHTTADGVTPTGSIQARIEMEALSGAAAHFGMNDAYISLKAIPSA